MNTYRARPLEVQAIDLGDGRHVILGDSPRYMATADFLEGFELAQEKRVAERRATNGHGKPKGRTERRSAPGRRRKNGGVDARQVEGLELLAKGKSVKEVAKKFGVHTATVYLWRKNAGKSNGKPAAKAAPRKEPVPVGVEQASQKRCRHCGQSTPAEGKWCIHCMQNP